jgi:hypothetical protein
MHRLEVTVMSTRKDGSMAATRLSDEALALFRLHVTRGGHILITNENRDIYDELVKAGLMAWGHTFRDGRNSICRLTKAGFDRKTELLALAKEAV